MTERNTLGETLDALTDAELDAYVDEWRERRERYREADDEFSAWWCSKILSAALVEQERRRR